MSAPPFSVRDDDPFVVFRALQEIARNAKGEDVIDLSRGDPGYGFTPSQRGRKFASYILFLDSVLNASAEEKFAGDEDPERTWERIRRATKSTYQSTEAEELLTLLQEFTTCIMVASEKEGKRWDDAAVLRALFLGSAMSGGTYLAPKGEELTRTVVAAWHRRELGLPVKSCDLILTNGASHAIGALFKALGEEGCGYLKEGDTVCIASPVYAPYNRILEERKLNVVTFSIDPLSGHCDIAPLLALNRACSGSGLHCSTAPKVLFLIHPHNPTGFALADTQLHTLTQIARAQNMLVISDEVYLSFFPEKRSFLHVAPERTIAINARSKVERSTGLRFGEIMTLPEGREHIAAMLKLKDAETFERLLLFAKAPGRSGGEFQHTTFVPGPSQLLGMAHIILGLMERTEYLRSLRENQVLFQRALDLPHRGNLYYVIFDLSTLKGCRTANLPMEQRLRSLAEAGVMYLPAYRFFAPSDRSKPGVVTCVRASLVNATAERLQEAARRTKEVLCG